MCKRYEAGRWLAGRGVIRPLVSMLAAGMESMRRGTGGGLYPVFPANTSNPAGDGNARGSSENKDGITSSQVVTRSYASSGAMRACPAPVRIEALDSNAHAACTAALLALAGVSGEARSEVELELVFQEAWLGVRVRLEGLNAPADS